jgi:hypothetical protein
MTTFGGMPGRVFGYSAIFHVAVIVTLYGLAHWHFFRRDFEEETPIVVQIINVGPQTRATQVNPTPPQPEKPPQVAQAEPAKPETPKPEPPAPPPEPKPAPPEPKPEPKPEPPKPPQPKPEAELPKPPPSKPQPTKTKDDATFDTLLKNLAKHDPAREAPKQVATTEPKASSQPIAPLGSSLTMSERDFVLQQLRNCWAEPVGARDEQTLFANIRIYMNPDATVRSAEIVDHNNLQFAESARRAALNPSCHQLKLPLDKYGGSDGWNSLTVTFRPTGVS